MLTQLFTSIAEAIRNKKGTTETIKASDFPTEIATIESGIDTSDATATAEDIAIDKTAYVNSEKVTGTVEVVSDELLMNGQNMIDSMNGYCYDIVSEKRKSKVMLDNSSQVAIRLPKQGIRTILGISASKIKAGETVAGTTGTFTKDGTAIENHILENEVAYVNGKKVTGTMPNNGDLTITPTIAEQTIPEGYTSGGIVEGVTAEIDSNIKAENIKKDVEILGVVGEFEGSGSSEYNAIIVPNGLDTNTSIVTTSYVLNKLIKSIPLIDTSGWKSTYYMFYSCSNLTSIPLLDTSNVTNMSYMFYDCNSLTTIPQLNTSKVTSMNRMFMNCKSLIIIPQLDTSNVTNMAYMFENCSKLKSVPQLNTINVTSMAYMFNYCSELISIQGLNTENVVGMNYMFGRCENLVSVPLLNAEKVYDINNMFTTCYELTSFDGLKDLGKAYTKTTANYTNYRLDLSLSTKLTYESLINIINNLYDLNLTYDVANGGTLYTQSLKLGNTNLAKLTDEEIAIATLKGWTVS